MSLTATPRERLEAHDIRVHFVGVKAVDGVDFLLERGEILGLIGPNGAGKTTLLNVLSGYEKPTTGTVVLSGKEITSFSPDRIARQGLGRTFQNIRVFGRLNVFENVELGALGANLPRSEARSLAWELLRDSHLHERAAERAESLPHGAERTLGILRAVAMRPRFLLLDEPAAGLNEAESTELVEFLARLPGRFDLGLLVIEHNMQVVMQLCERIHVIDHGKTIAIGTPNQVQKDPAVLSAYLGT